MHGVCEVFTDDIRYHTILLRVAGVVGEETLIDGGGDLSHGFVIGFPGLFELVVLADVRFQLAIVDELVEVGLSELVPPFEFGGADLVDLLVGNLVVGEDGHANVVGDDGVDDQHTHFVDECVTEIHGSLVEGLIAACSRSPMTDRGCTLLEGTAPLGEVHEADVDIGLTLFVGRLFLVLLGTSPAGEEVFSGLADGSDCRFVFWYDSRGDAESDSSVEGGEMFCSTSEDDTIKLWNG